MGPVLVFNPHVAFAQATEPHPPAVPSNAAVGADVPDFEAVRALERRHPVRHWSNRPGVTRHRRLLIEGLVRALVVELVAKDIEAALLGREAAGRRTRRLRLQRAMHPFMAAVLRRAAGLDELRQDAQANPPRRPARCLTIGCSGRCYALPLNRSSGDQEDLACVE